jgi:multidrug transporter EmrE-like cation transporter
MMLFWAPLGWWLGRDAVPLWGAVEWGFIVASGVLHVVYYVTLLRGYRKADLTVVYPLARGTGPLLSSLVAITLLGERISALGALGIIGVVGGVFLIAGGPALLRAAHDPAARARVHKGLVYGVVTGAFIASYTVVDGYAVKVLLMSPILVDYISNFVRVALLAPVVLRDLPTAVLWSGSSLRCWWPWSAPSPTCWCCTPCAVFARGAAREVSMLVAVLMVATSPAAACAAACSVGVTALALG